MLFCLKDGDAFPTEALGLPSRLGPAAVEMPADWFAQRDFERLCYPYPDGSFHAGDGREPCPVQSAATLSLEPPIPGPADKEIRWAPVLGFHSERIGGIAYEAARKQIIHKLQGAKPSWSDLFQFLQSLRSIPSL